MKIPDFMKLAKSKIVPTSSIENAEPEDSLRALVIIRDIGAKPFSGNSSKFVGSVNTSYWLIESLSPVLLVSSPVVDKKANIIEMLELRNTLRDKYTCVAGILSVRHSVIGGGVRFGFGSTGVNLSTLVRASVLLPYSDSWIENSNTEFNHPSFGSEKCQPVDDLIFSVWGYDPGR
jgi:hypothetical protein